MTEILIASELERMVGELADFSGELATYRDELARVLADTRTHVESLFGHWSGPRADSEILRAFAFVDVLSTGREAFDAEIAIVDAAVRFANELVPDLQRQEQWRADTTADLATVPPEGKQALLDDIRSADSEIGEISARWAYAANQWFCTNLDRGTAKLSTLKDATVPPLTGYPVPQGLSYLERLARFSVTENFTFDEIDPTGATTAAAWAVTSGLLASGETGEVVFVAMETANNGDDRDQHASENDAGAVTDRETAEAQVIRALPEVGAVVGTNEEVDDLVNLTVATGWIVQALWNDDIEGQIDAQLEVWSVDDEPMPDGSGDSGAGDIVSGAVTDGIPSAIEVIAPESAASVFAGRLGLGADAILTVADVLNGESVPEAVVSLTGETLVWSVLPPSAPVVVFGGLAIFLGAMWIAEQAPYIEADWTFMGAGPLTTPADAARGPADTSVQLNPNGGNPGGTLGTSISCPDLHFAGLSDPRCPQFGLEPVGDVTNSEWSE